MRRSREREEEEGEKFQPHDRRLKGLQGENQEHHQPQKCPRCESLNTKFCYYNNYSLSQPRYFCKACRRYWTQGGTLRNVPVGGGCRRGKRPKISTSSSSSGENLRNIMPPNVISSSPMIKNSIPPPEILETGSLAPLYFPSGGYVSSFSQPQTFNHSFSLGHETGSSSNLSFLQGGFNVNHLLQSEQQKQRQIQSTPFYQMDEREKITPSLYSSQPLNWPQPVAGAGVFWTVGNSTAFNTSSRSDHASSNHASSSLSSLNPTGWSNIPGYNHNHPPDPRS